MYIVFNNYFTQLQQPKQTINYGYLIKQRFCGIASGNLL